MQQLYNDFEQLIDETLDQCFKKTRSKQTPDSFAETVHHSYKSQCKKLIKFSAKGKVQRKVASQYRECIVQMNAEKVSEINNVKLQQRVASLSENDRFSAQKFWKAKKSIQGSERTCHSVYDKTGHEVFEPEKIIETYRQEFDDRLSSVQINPLLQDFKERTDKLCEEIIKMASAAKQHDFVTEELDKVL